MACVKDSTVGKPSGRPLCAGSHHLARCRWTPGTPGTKSRGRNDCQRNRARYTTMNDHPFLVPVAPQRPNAMRQALTVLGLVVGLAAATVLVGFGQSAAAGQHPVQDPVPRNASSKQDPGSSEVLQKAFAGMSANNLLVMPGP